MLQETIMTNMVIAPTAQKLTNLNALIWSWKGMG